MEDVLTQRDFTCKELQDWADSLLRDNPYGLGVSLSRFARAWAEVEQDKLKADARVRKIEKDLIRFVNLVKEERESFAELVVLLKECRDYLSFKNDRR